MDLGRIQFLSLFTKGLTTALGIIQSVIIVRLLTAGEYGIVGLVLSIGGLIGVSQHLGIVDGAIREIAVLKNKRDIGKVFWVSHITRQLITLPLSLALVFLARFIAVDIYHRPEIVPYIQLFAVILILQGLQDVLGATLTGIKQFKGLYAAQIITATINIAVFGYLVWQGKILGFFWAMIITTSIMLVILLYLTIRELRGNLALPTWTDIREFSRRVMKTGVFMYVSRILFVVWHRLPLLLLGGVLTSEELGYLNVSLTFGSKLTIIAAALSEVNLSWMSSLFATQQEQFREVVQRNMQRVLLLMIGLTLGLIFFTPEILQYVIGAQYLVAEHLILVMTLAFFLYALTDIGTSSLFVSADRPRLRMWAYSLMTLVSGAPIALMLVGEPNAFWASVAVLAGAVVAYGVMILLAKRAFGVRFLTPQLGFFVVALFMAVAWLFTDPPLIARLVVLVLLSAYIAWESHRRQLLPQAVSRFLGGTKPPAEDPLRIICFAGATYQQPAWTNRQHMMSRVSQHYPVLYVEPRKWIFRVLANNWRNPGELVAFFKRLFWYERKSDRLFIKAQANILPGSREIKAISLINHWLNRVGVALIAWWLGFSSGRLCLWLYDTEAAQYLPVWPEAIMLYDCVDNHEVQAGVDRNPQRVQEEEEAILKRADVVTVTSERLFELKRIQHPNAHLALNAGDVELFMKNGEMNLAEADQYFASIKHPIIGTVGALDSYKVDFALLHTAATQHPEWHFVFVGAPVVDQRNADLDKLRTLPNTHFIGAIFHERVPAYVRHFDVCIIPYKSNAYNEASFPLKFWEFMATGKPVVVSGLPELKKYATLIGYAATPDEFSRLIAAALAQPKTNRTERVALAKEHSWERRVERVLALLRQAISNK
jgi:O-antigen/teichoic acid export membrane protein/glycosyltransferase involved in cell wall biosynthesis